MQVNRTGRMAAMAATLALSTAVVTALAATPAVAVGGTPAQATVTGVHNTYVPTTYPFLAQALDAGTGMIELDT